MDDLLAIGSEYVTAVGSIGIITGIYVLSFLFCFGNNDDSKIIRHLTSVIKAEVSSLKEINSENPYDIFTKIYPNLKEMDNESMNEFIDILNQYNKKWIKNE
jgi:hypothetical protein